MCKRATLITLESFKSLGLKGGIVTEHLAYTKTVDNSKHRKQLIHTGKCVLLVQLLLLRRSRLWQITCWSVCLGVWEVSPSSAGPGSSSDGEELPGRWRGGRLSGSRIEAWRWLGSNRLLYLFRWTGSSPMRNRRRYTPPVRIATIVSATNRSVRMRRRTSNTIAVTSS